MVKFLTPGPPKVTLKKRRKHLRERSFDINSTETRTPNSGCTRRLRFSKQKKNLYNNQKYLKFYFC